MFETERVAELVQAGEIHNRVPPQRVGARARRHFGSKRIDIRTDIDRGPSTAADEKLALALHHRGVSLLHVERAILLGALRKYAAVRQNGRGTPISSLHYFANLFEEVQQEISTQYWNYVAHKVNTFEQTELWAIPGRTLEK